MESLAAKNKQALTKKTYEVSFDLSNTNYEAVENIGSGAYGVVCSAINKLTKDKVAIKKIPNIFQHEVIVKRTYREIRILKHFRHDNIIAIREILKPNGQADSLKDVFIVLDLMESDLHRIIHSKQELSIDHVKYFLYQILCGLQYIHSANVVHRDLKPSNLLVNANCDLKIGDFGMARGMGFIAETNSKLTQYVATRWYRAPELTLSNVPYTASIDMWSVGCIFGELLGRKIMFAGKDPLQQLHLIMDTLGEPPKHLQENYFELQNVLINGYNPSKPRSLRQRLSASPALALDLLERLLVYDPNTRLDVHETLRHHFLAKYHDPDSVYEKPCIPVFNFDFEKKDLSKSQLRDAILEEIMFYHKPKRKSKIPFNFKPVPKAELEKTQQLKAAVLKAKQQNQQKQVPVEEAGARSSRDNVMAGQQAVATLKEFIDGTSAAPTQSAHQPDATTAVTDNRNVFKEPPKVVAASIQHSQVLQVSTRQTQAAAGVDVEMPSAGQSGRKQSVAAANAAVLANEETEMLSADVDVRLKVSDDFRIDLTQVPTAMKPAEVKASVQHAYTDSDGQLQGKKTNTLEKLKAVVLESAMRKQRGEVVSRHRPVTAMQRQKEKEEKRRKKLEKAREKKKKKAKDQSPLLTQEDRELLKRWTNMQQEKEQPQQQQPVCAPAKRTSGHVTVDSGQQARTVLSPKDLNLASEKQGVSCSATSAVTSQSQTVKPILPNTLQRGFPVSEYANTSTPAAQMYVVPRYIPAAQPDSIQSHTGAGVIPQQPPAYNRPAIIPGSVPAAANTHTLSSMMHTHSVAPANMSNTRLPQPINSAVDTGSTHASEHVTENSSFLQMLYNTKQPPPPLYHQSARRVNTDLTAPSSDSQSHSTAAASNSGISLSEFLPFQSYDPSLTQFSGSSCPEPLTPDLSMFDSAPVVKSPADASSSPGAQASMMPQSGDGDNVMTSQVVAAGVTLTVTNADQISNPLNVVHSLNAGAGTSAATASTSTIASTSTHDGNSQVLSIITQMKKSHVNDPLMLALTPKTTGDPYGVGPDIVPDDFFSEDRVSAQLSAMSVSSATESLIGDWLAVSGMDGVDNKDYETLSRVLETLEPQSPAQPRQ